METQSCTDGIELVVFGANESELDFHIPVHYVGYVGNLWEKVSLYNLADITIVPSLSENLSCTIMESLSCGTPVVAFNIGGNGDMIEHQTNGYLAKERDDASLAEGILWCLNNNEQLGKAARAKVLGSFTLEAVGRQYMGLYESVLQ